MTPIRCNEPLSERGSESTSVGVLSRPVPDPPELSDSSLSEGILHALGCGAHPYESLCAFWVVTQCWLQCMERCGVEGPVCTGAIFSENCQKKLELAAGNG